MAPFMNRKSPIIPVCRARHRQAGAHQPGGGHGRRQLTGVNLLAISAATDLNHRLGHLKGFGQPLDLLHHLRRFGQHLQMATAAVRTLLEPVDVPFIDLIGWKRFSFVPGMPPLPSDRAGTGGATARGGRLGDIAGRGLGRVARVFMGPSQWPLQLPNSFPKLGKDLPGLGPLRFQRLDFLLQAHGAASRSGRLKSRCKG